MTAKKQIKTKKLRIKKQPEYKSFKLSKRIKPNTKPLPGIAKLLRSTFQPLNQNRKLFIGFVLLLFFINIVFVIGINSIFDFLSVKKQVEDSLSGLNTSSTQSLALLGYVISIGSGGGNSNLQFFITLLASLAIIWAIRQTMAKEKVSLKQSFYEGVYPIVPFLIVLFFIGLQLLPLVIGNFLLTTVISNGLAVTVLEQTLWWMLFILLAILSLYMIMSSIFALYIVTLPGMTPVKALRSARGLVIYRRINVALRLLVLPVLGIFFYVVILLPLILVVPAIVIPAFALLSGGALLFVHSYIYNLYRSLL